MSNVGVLAALGTLAIIMNHCGCWVSSLDHDNGGHFQESGCGCSGAKLEGLAADEDIVQARSRRQDWIQAPKQLGILACTSLGIRFCHGVHKVMKARNGHHIILLQVYSWRG